MISQLRFFARHSANDLRINGQRTVFALLCIAAGVAAIVSLQTLGVMIDDSLTGSLQESNGGDLQLRAVEGENFSEEKALQGREAGILESSGASVLGGHRTEESSYYFSSAGVDQIKAWFNAQAPGSTITARQVMAGAHGPMAATSISNLRTNKDQMFAAPYIVDTSAYPLYGTREDEDGTALRDLLVTPTDIVINRGLADTLDAVVGDVLRINGASTDFTLRGIVAGDAESGFENIGGALFGFFYLDSRAVPFFDGVDLGIDRLYVKLENPDQVETVRDAFMAQFPYLYSVTTGDLEEENSQVSDILNQLVMVMGLVSLLIGGIGIINTMQVVVSRRTGEIAVLKTIGLTGEEVTILFLIEAVLLGLIGSVIGVGLGWAAAYAFKGIAGAFVAQSLTLRLTPEPALTGLIVGVLVTAIFGFMPTLAAGQVRPNRVFRPNDTIVPQAGRAQSLLALLVMLAVLSVIAQPLVGSMLSSSLTRLIAGGVGAVLGLLGSGLVVIQMGRRKRAWLGLLTVPCGLLLGYVFPAALIIVTTFVVVSLLYMGLWLLIWLVGRFFPAGRWVELKVALRNMLVTKVRGASTLLALVIGVFTLSLITMLATAVSNRLEEMLVNEAGGNVIIFASGEGDTVDRLSERLAETEGVNGYSVVGAYGVELVALEDTSTGQTIPYAELEARVQAQVEGASFGPGRRMNQLSFVMGSIDARSVTTNLPDVDFYSGRQLAATDAGQPRIVIPANDATLAAGFEVGDWLIFRLVEGDEPVEIRLEVVGMVDRTGSQMRMEVASPSYAPDDAFPAGYSPDNLSAIVDVAPGRVGDLKRATADIPGVFVMETRLINDLVNRLIKQFTSFPILVASLALVVGGIVIANSVALATLERRREIGIMKAIGLQRERVLGILLLENGLMGFIGGLIGVGISSALLLLLMISVFGGNLGNSIPYMTAMSLMSMCVGIALLAAFITAWGASGEKPLNVLRYE